MSVREIADASHRFARHHGAAAELVVRAPGRVNLLGEHTDYNEGYVCPAAIDRSTLVATRSRRDSLVRIVAADLDDEDVFSLDRIEHSFEHPWSDYVRGVAAGLAAVGHSLKGADMLIKSNLPRGAGLSSSAALEVAVAHAFSALNGLDLSGKEIALIAQGAENDFVGVKCGIMDQFVVALGESSHALLLDCRDLSYRAVPLPPRVNIVVCDSRIERRLAASGYNQRRAECQEAVRLFRHWYPDAQTLRDVSVGQFQQHEQELPDHVRARARHVVTENARTLEGALVLESGDVAAFGKLMNESHRSLRDDYEVCPPEIDLLAEAARRVPGCYGSRLTGAGFGGCTVSLVADSGVALFRREVGEAYRAGTGRDAKIYVCWASDGVRNLAPLP